MKLLHDLRIEVTGRTVHRTLLIHAGVDLSLPDDVLRHRFPRFPGRATALEVTLEAGQMLYLPAGGCGWVRTGARERLVSNSIAEV